MVSTEFKHLMFDIETLGNKSFSVITSIAAMPFNLETGKYGGTYFKEYVDIKSCLDVGLNINADTLQWWMKQDETARDQFKIKGRMIGDVLSDMSCYLDENFNMDELQVWGNSNRFDMGILDNAYETFDQPIPWNFYNERDVRTLVSFRPEIKEEEVFEGIKHDPIDDIKHQIKYCSKIWKTLNHQ